MEKQELGKWLYIDDFDCAFDYPAETFGQMLEKLGREVPTAFVKVHRETGSGGGWPQCEIIVNEVDLEKFLEFFGHDDVDWYRNEVAKPL